MERHFDHDLAELKGKLLTMASHAEKAVGDSVTALVNRDLNLALQVKANDEILDRFEMEIDETAITLLARAPLASDLRLVTVAMKISQNLERAGDEATKIAKRARDLCNEPPLKLALALPQMSTLALGLLKSSLDAFVNRDSSAARGLIPRDKQVNALHKEMQQQLIAHMKENPDYIARCLHFLVAAKSLERIADHATNIAEEVVYLYEATDIRHADKA
ncbi:MAG: phosphate signaling complex protein PhoU [Verrucomicrobiota bacterium]